METLKHLNWKVAAGGALAGLAMGGLAVADGGSSTETPVNIVQLTPTDPAVAPPNGPLASPSSEIVVTQTPVVAPVVAPVVTPIVVEIPAQVLPTPVVLTPAVDATAIDSSGAYASVASVASVDSVSVASVASVSVASVDSID